jgi:DNA-3-methyladenine glycosylase
MKREFYERDTSAVAKDLLGKVLIRMLNNETLGGKIVETEAYYGRDDPASRAFKGKKNYNKVMWKEPGHIFIYNVHRYWMFNFVAHKKNRVGGVLIRAIEPIKGIDTMKKKRPVKNLRNLTNGPGKLTMALAIDKSLNFTKATSENCEIYVIENELRFEIECSHRIGVKKDLDKKLRFFIKGNMFVS